MGILGFWDRIFGVSCKNFWPFLYILGFQGNLRVRERVLEVLTEEFLKFFWEVMGKFRGFSGNFCTFYAFRGIFGVFTISDIIGGVLGFWIF